MNPTASRSAKKRVVSGEAIARDAFIAGRARPVVDVQRGNISLPKVSMPLQVKEPRQSNDGGRAETAGLARA